jgi:hypothetical protein
MAWRFEGELHVVSSSALTPGQPRCRAVEYSCAPTCYGQWSHTALWSRLEDALIGVHVVLGVSGLPSDHLSPSRSLKV